MNHVLSNVSLILSSAAQNKILRHINAEPALECGWYLIGTIENRSDDMIVGRIDDIYVIEGSGTSANFTFTSASGLQAYAYCKKMYSSDGISKKGIIGNYHSHGNYHTYFSSTDEKMIESSTSREFYLVFSPSQQSFTAIYKDTDAQIYQVACKHDVPEYRYIFPQMGYITKWKINRIKADNAFINEKEPPEEKKPVVNTENSEIKMKIIEEINNMEFAFTCAKCQSLVYNGFLVEVLPGSTVKWCEGCVSEIPGTQNEFNNDPTAPVSLEHGQAISPAQSSRSHWKEILAILIVIGIIAFILIAGFGFII
jgi:proteasome lid subunit RPN8/RPN11